MKIVVIGGSGLIGKKLVTRLHERGHEAVAASPSSGFNVRKILHRNIKNSKKIASSLNNETT